jgi:hypothetical protein
MLLPGIIAPLTKPIRNVHGRHFICEKDICGWIINIGNVSNAFFSKYLNVKDNRQAGRIHGDQQLQRLAKQLIGIAFKLDWQKIDQ